MKVFSYSEAQKNLSRLLTLAQEEDIAIRRDDGTIISLRSTRGADKSAFDVPGIDTQAQTSDILEVIRDSRDRGT